MSDLKADLDRLSGMVLQLQKENRELKGENARLRQEIKKMADWITPAIVEYKIKFPPSEGHPI